MKKILILLTVLLLLSGCINIEDSSYEGIIAETTRSKSKIYNTYRKGYKFYLPQGLYIKNSKEYNEVIKSDKETFYLYIDLISYLNKSPVEYEEEQNLEYTTKIQEGEKTGYVKVKLYKNDKYIVEIAYNYAKIEVIVEKSRLNKAMSDALIILSSIKYNDSFLTSLSDESLLNYEEEVVDLFGQAGDSGSNQIEWQEKYDSDYDNTPPDLDLIN